MAGPESRKVWGPLRDGVRGHGMFQRIENSAGSGQGDVFYCLQGRQGWIELKYLDSWPVRDTTETTLDIRKIQKLWHERLLENGGKSFVFARIGEEWLLIPACAGLGKATREEWEQRALLHNANGVDWSRLMDILTL